MFLFETLSVGTILMWIGVTLGLIALNELARLNKWISLVLFIAVPAVLTIFVWPNTSGADSSTGTWFHWVKVYSALAGCLGFMAIRFIPKCRNKYWLMFPPFILAFNILEAVIRDFQVFGMKANGIVDGVMMVSGPWNLLNGIAGLINIITITGWMGIYVSKKRGNDMMWPDMIWPWIIAYDIWNFAYVYNCVSDHSFYAGAALLASCTIAHFVMKKGAWLEHRAQTLAFWMMFTMSVPSFVSDSKFSVDASHKPAAWLTVSVLSIIINVSVLVYQIYRMKKYHTNPLKEEIYKGTHEYEVAAADR